MVKSRAAISAAKASSALLLIIATTACAPVITPEHATSEPAVDPVFSSNSDAADTRFGRSMHENRSDDDHGDDEGGGMCDLR